MYYPDQEAEEVKFMTDELEEVESKLTSWEREFVSSMQERWHEGRSLTDTQLAKLRELHAQKA